MQVVAQLKILSTAGIFTFQKKKMKNAVCNPVEDTEHGTH